MRESKKQQILRTALALGAEQGVDAVTFEAIAERLDMTRGGVVYHFPTKADLLDGAAGLLLEQWEALALDTLGKPLDKAGRPERIEALVRSTAQGEVVPGELAFLVSGAPQARALDERWRAVLLRWIGDPEELTAIQKVALLAVEGLWQHAVNGSSTLGAWHRTPPEVVDLVVDLARGDRPTR